MNREERRERDDRPKVRRGLSAEQLARLDATSKTGRTFQFPGEQPERIFVAQEKSADLEALFNRFTATIERLNSDQNPANRELHIARLRGIVKQARRLTN